MGWWSEPGTAGPRALGTRQAPRPRHPPRPMHVANPSLPFAPGVWEAEGEEGAQGVHRRHEEDADDVPLHPGGCGGGWDRVGW